MLAGALHLLRPLHLPRSQPGAMEQDAASEVAPPPAPPQEAEAGDSVVAAAARITYDSDSDTDSTEEGDDGPRPLPTGPPPPVPERNPDTEAPALPSPAQQSPPSAGFAGEAGSPAPGQPSSSPAEAQEGDVEEEDAAPRQRRSSLVVSFAKGVGNRLGLRQKGAPGSTASDAGGAPAETGQAEAAPGGDAPRRRPSVSRPLPSLQTAEAPAGSPHSVHSDPGAEEGVDGGACVLQPSAVPRMSHPRRRPRPSQMGSNLSSARRACLLPGARAS